MPPLIKQDNVILRTGRIDLGHQEVRLDPERFPDAPFGVVVCWKQSDYPYLPLQFRVGGKPAPEGPEAYAELCRTLQLPEEWHVPPTDLKAAFVSRRGQLLTLSGYVDTNDSEFCRLAEQMGSDADSAVVFQVTIRFVMAGRSERTRIGLALTPVLPADNYEGYVGLDLGNHNSTIAACDIRTMDKMALLKEPPVSQNARISPDGAPVLSTLFYRSVPDGKFDDSIDSISWEIGEQARQRAQASMHGVELAAKRLVASPDYQKTKEYRVLNRHSGKADRIVASLPMSLAGELLACRMLHWFREATRKFPSKIAISYPTTYTEREVAQVREIVHKAWLRMKPSPQNEETLRPLALPFPGPAALADDDEGILLMLDEASAAAFFFLSEKILSAPGQRSRFRYLYPNGLNLLLFDCGGGTTDIALVRALVRPNNPRKLTFTVRGRVGHRHFGGDYITESVFRILKAKVAAMLASADRTVQPFPVGQTQSRDSLQKYLQANASSIDKIIPTRFSKTFADDAMTADDQDRLNRAMNLWRVAEETKIHLAASSDGSYRVPEIWWEPLRIPGLDANRRVQLSALKISQAEVDLLVRDKLSEVIDVCNRLIFQKLVQKEHTGIEEEHGDAEEVHWVAVAGAASRYPLIPQMLREKLDVPFIKSEDEDFQRNRLTVDDSNLKHAVAKGLARILMTKDMRPDDRVAFDSDLSRRLPFEVSYRDSEGHRQILFRENAHVDSMVDPRPLFPEVAVDARDRETLAPGEGTGQFVVLYRRFPGENRDVPYLRFHFRYGIEGDLRVRYEKETVLGQSGQSPFIMTNETTGDVGICMDLTPPETYLHPVQRGDL